MVSVSDGVIWAIIGAFLPVLPFPALGCAQCGVLHPALSCVAKREAAASVFGLCAQRNGGQRKGLGLALHLQTVAQFAALPHAVGYTLGVVAGNAGYTLQPMRGFGQGEFGQSALTSLLGMKVIGQRKTAEYGDDRHHKQQLDQGETTKDASHGDKWSRRNQPTACKEEEGLLASSEFGCHKACQPA